MHVILMRVHSVVTLLESCEASATIVLRAPAALFIPEVLAGVGSEESCTNRLHVSRHTKRNTIPQEASELTDVLSVLTTSLHLGLVVWLRKWLLLASHPWNGAVGGIIKLRPVVSLLQHDRTVAKLLYQTVLALDGGVGDLGDLVALEAVPTLIASRIDKIDDIQRINEVDESVPNIAIIRKINTQVHEVILSPA